MLYRLLPHIIIIHNTIKLMKDKSIPKRLRLTDEEMRSLVGSERLDIYESGSKCFARFQCYDNSIVECSGAKDKCSSIESNNEKYYDFIIGVMCGGTTHICDPAFPSNPSGSGSAGCTDIKKVACASKPHGDRCFWTCDGKTHSGTCQFNPLDWSSSKGLYCSETGFGTRENDKQSEGSEDEQN